MNFLNLFKKPNLIAAHRGDNRQKPENSLSALVSSIGKCDFIEVDVQLTKDLIPVVIHDKTLTRTSNVSKIKKYANRKPWKVCEFKLEELKTLDFGHWFDDNYEPILTLEIALKFAQKHHLFLNIEIKDLSTVFADEIVIKTIIDMIQEIHAEDLVLISSFYHPYLPLSKKLSSKIPTAALQETKHPKNLIDYLHTLQVDAYHPEITIINEETVTKLKTAGFLVNVFTVNTIKEQNKLFHWGVNGIVTDIISHK